MKNITLFRYPMAFSLLGDAYQAFAKQFDVSILFTQTEVAPGPLAQAIKNFYEHGGNGANVTIPLKEEAYALCQWHSSRAQAARSVNVLYWEDGTLCGDNSDGVGLVRDI